jgi:hypothetical protein
VSGLRPSSVRMDRILLLLDQKGLLGGDAGFLEDGFLQGFRLGSQSDPARARVKVRNLPSAGLQTGAISAALRLERDKRWALGPFASPPPDVGGWAKAWLSPLGLVPKGSTDGSLKYRLIFHLSSGNPADFPGGVNGSIPRDLTVTRYPSFDEVLQFVGFLRSGVRARNI